MEIEEKLNKYLTKWQALASDYELEKYERKACEDAYYDFIQLKQSLPPKQEKVEVPEFVADYLEMRKEQFSVDGLGGAIMAVFGGYSKPDVSKWMNSNVELFARAWLDGYTVKKEPEWVVAIPGQGAFSGLIEFDKKRKGVSSTCDNQTSVKFTDKAKAEAVALLIGGEIVPVEEEAE